MLRLLLVLWMSSSLMAFENERQELLQTMSSEWIERGVYAAAKLHLAEHLKTAKTSQELAELTSLKAHKIERLLKTLATRGIFQEVEEGLFLNTPQSELLIKDHPESLYHLALFYGEEIHKAFDCFLPSLASDETAFQIAYGKTVFSYFKDHPERLRLFQAAMKEKSQAVIQSLLTKGDFSRTRSLLDIGGGQGHLLSAVQKKFPEIKGALFELPEVAESLKNPAFEVIAGDFFKSIPKGYDTYIMKSVIHDWNDDQAIEILTKCHEAMSADAELIIVDVVLQPESLYAHAMDLLMLSITGGKERREEDFFRMASLAGFEIQQMIPTSTEFSLIVLKKR